MTNPTKNTTAAASGRISSLFDVSTVRAPVAEGVVEYVPLEQLELAHNPRNDIDPDGISRLAAMLMRTGQLVPCIGRRVADERVLLYAGQRRRLAARRSHELAGTEGYERLSPVVALMVLLLDHEPAPAEIRRIQAQENSRESLSMRDRQAQFADCWSERAGMREDERIASVCEDLGISPRAGWNLRRQLTLPEPVRGRVEERPTGAQISITLANRLADMNEISTELTEAVAERVTSPELHERALSDLGAFVQRTVVENEGVYAVRVDDGALLDCQRELDRARAHLDQAGRSMLSGALGCEPDQLDKTLDELAGRCKTAQAKLRVDGRLRDRAANGRYAWTFKRGEDFADGVWVVDPAFMIEAIHQHAQPGEQAPAREEQYFHGAGLSDEEMRKAAAEAKERRAEERRERDRAITSNLGLGEDIRAGLLDPRGEQLDALRDLICQLLAHHYPDVIAYGAGWTDRERQQPIADRQSYEPKAPEAILDAELARALSDPDPLHGIAQLASRFAAAFVLDPAGVMRTKQLGAERMGRRLQQALPGGEHPIRQAVWALMRPMLSPRLAELNRDAFVVDEAFEQTADLEQHRAASRLEDLDLEGEGQGAEADAA